jgi:hypothetical protein
MNKLTIFLLFSAFMITLVAVSIIPEMIVPDYDGSNFFINKKKTQKIEKIGYQIEKTTDVACVVDSDCVTPGEYLMMSRCPFTSKCLDGKCAVVCPNF